jgi:hypothetical protein
MKWRNVKMQHSIKERQYICLLLNRLFPRLVPDDAPNKTEIAMEWLMTIRDVDKIMLSVRGGNEPFCVNAENNYMCFEGEYSASAGICPYCGKLMVKHIVKEGARYHVTSWDYHGVHCSEPDCERNHGVGKCVPKDEESPRMRGPPYWNDY